MFEPGDIVICTHGSHKYIKGKLFKVTNAPFSDDNGLRLKPLTGTHWPDGLTVRHGRRFGSGYDSAQFRKL